MDEEGHINFKALRAKFQEEALLAQSKTGRPAVSEKPKYIPPPGGHCTPVVSSINTAAENKTSGLTRVIFRDALRTSGGKRPISFPPQPQRISPSPQLTDGGGTARHSRYMPLVLPVLPAKDQKAESTAKKEHKVEPEPGKDVLPQPKIKKKGLLLPFKSVKPSKVSAESGEELPYDYLATRLCSPPGELPSVEKQTTEDGVSLQSDQSTTEWPLSSPDVSVTPPSAETCADSDSKIISTLEKAKKKFSRRSILTSSKPKSLHSPDGTCRHKVLPSPPKNTDSTGAELPIPPPVCLPPLACISARPFFKASSSLRKSPFQKELGREKSENLPVKTAGPHPPCVPQKKLPPDLRTLGPLPAKPPRPPIVNLSRYYAPLLEVSLSLSKAPVEEPESEHPPVSNPVLDAPEFPDFENTESETPGGGGVDIAALELEALDLVSTNPPAAAGAERPQPDLSARDPAGAVESSIIQDLNLGSENIIPLDPASFPEPINLSEFPEPAVPEQRSQSEEVLVESFSKSPSDETDVGVAECQSFPEETELSNHSSVHQQDSYYETYTNVYEDVESINKFTLGQNLNKRKGSLKNPYAENQRKKEEPYLNKRQRNPWVGVSAEYLAPNHIHSPNTTDHKERKKREKQRLEKEKKEQKEREKKENEMKKKFKVTGDEEPMYHAKVMVASKVRKNDLPVKSGDTVSIIRTTNCPKGKWLARDANSKYGYISVMNVELNIKEMLELGKKAQAAGKGSNTEGDNISIGSRSSNHPVLTSSFTDDSEEWAYEDETLSPFSESHSFPQQTASVPETSYTHVVAQNTPNDASPQDVHSQNRHEALHKLAVFFQHAKDELGDVPDDGVATFTNDEPQNLLSTVEELPYPEQEVDFTELELLPPPPIFADT